jgi:hypothetical protein
MRSGFLRLSWVALGFGALLGCEDEYSSLVLWGVGVPDDTCVFKPDPEGTFRPRGLLDVGLGTQYTAWVVAANQLAAKSNKAQLRSETAGILVEGAEVQVEDANGGVQAEYTVPVSAYINPGSGENPGFGAVLVPLLSAQQADEIAAELTGDPSQTVTRVSTVRVFGHTVGGESVESTKLSFPIRVCAYCTVDYSKAAVDVQSGDLVCVPGEGDDEDAEDLPCFAGQDEPTPCKLCATDPNCRNP